MIYLIAAAFALIAAIRPGITTIISDQPPARSAPTDTGTWFVCGTSDQGPLLPVLVQSLSEFVTWFGQRATYSLLYDSLDAYFREGGRRVYVSRVVGPGVVVATRNLLDSGAAVSLVASAIGPGSYGNNIKVGVVNGNAGGTFQIQVTDASNVVLEQSNDLPDQASAIAWGLNSAYIRLALGASANNPTVVAAAALAGGTDDRSNITDTQWGTALARFTKDLGPGQVSFPGRTTSAAHAQLLQHATDNGRVAICDAPDTPTVATLTTLAQADRTNGRLGALFAPWAIVPGVVPNTTRTVPYSAIEAGIIARNDVTLNPNVPAAGRRGESFYASALSQTWTDADRQTLNAQGVNVAVNKNGSIRTYGYRSLTNPATDASWLDFGNARLVMFITANGEAILEDHLFDEIDGSGLLFGRVRGQLIAMMNELYTQRALFGATSGEAFAVVCDTSNNTPTSIANHELHAAVAFRASEMAEWIQLTLSKVPVNQTIA